MKVKITLSDGTSYTEDYANLNDAVIYNADNAHVVKIEGIRGD